MNTSNSKPMVVGTPEQELRLFWDQVKNRSSLSGALVNLDWDDLWPEAQEDVESLYKAAHYAKFWSKAGPVLHSGEDEVRPQNGDIWGAQ